MFYVFRIVFTLSTARETPFPIHLSPPSLSSTASCWPVDAPDGTAALPITPFVVITVTATLSGFDHSVTRAAASLGSNPVNTFMKVTLPLITPGVISGALFAFVTSFDEVIVVLFLAGLENTTIPIQMWVGLREQLSPTILAVATCLIIMSTLILVSAELLRRRSERLRGINR